MIRERVSTPSCRGVRRSIAEFRPLHGRLGVRLHGKRAAKDGLAGTSTSHDHNCALSSGPRPGNRPGQRPRPTGFLTIEFEEQEREHRGVPSVRRICHVGSDA